MIPPRPRLSYICAIPYLGDDSITEEKCKEKVYLLGLLGRGLTRSGIDRNRGIAAGCWMA